jgi:hypothetical protein
MINILSAYSDNTGILHISGLIDGAQWSMHLPTNTSKMKGQLYVNTPIKDKSKLKLIDDTITLINSSSLARMFIILINLI